MKPLKTINELIDDEIEALSDKYDHLGGRGAKLALHVVKDEILKEWAIAVVKENQEKIEQCKKDDVVFAITSKKKYQENTVRYFELCGIKQFLIDHFELTEEELSHG